MKKLIFAAMAALMLVACTQLGEKYKVTLTMPDGSTDGQTAYLTCYDSGDTLNQAVINNQVAVFEGTVDGSLMARMVVGDQRMEFIVEKGEIAVKWEDHEATGSPLNEKLNTLGKQLDDISDAAEKDSAAAMEAEAKIREAFHKAYLDNKDNGIGPWAFNYYVMFNEFSYDQLDSLLNTAPKNYRELDRVKKALNAAKQLQATAVGKQFTDFTDAKGVKLSDFAGKGKYALVDFWASWCGPCRKEIPNIKGLYEKYKDKMNFVGVAVWDKSEDTHKAMDELQIPWPVMEGEQNWTEPTDLYGISGIPHIMLIDPEGKIVARQLFGDELVSTIEALKL